MSEPVVGSRTLGPEQMDHYREHGFVVVPGLYGLDDVERYRSRFDEIIEGRVERGKMLVMKDVMVAKGAVSPEENWQRIAKIQDFEDDPVLMEYIRDSRTMDCVEQIIDSHDILSIHTMLINKPPGVDGRHPLHQDLLYFPFRPAEKIVASWTALDRCTKENGCLVVVPGTHKGELLEHENPDWEYLNLAYFGAKGFDANAERIHLEMEPGDTVFFHPILIHGSGRNRTARPRKSISAHYASAECVTNWEELRFGARTYRRVERRDR